MSCPTILKKGTDVQSWNHVEEIGWTELVLLRGDLFHLKIFAFFFEAAVLGERGLYSEIVDDLFFWVELGAFWLNVCLLANDAQFIDEGQFPFYEDSVLELLELLLYRASGYLEM